MCVDILSCKPVFDQTNTINHHQCATIEVARDNMKKRGIVCPTEHKTEEINMDSTQKPSTRSTLPDINPH